MMEAARIDPPTMLPQFISFITASAQEDEKPGVDVPTFDEEITRRLFPEHHEELLDLFAQTETPDWLSAQPASAYDAIRAALPEQKS